VPDRPPERFRLTLAALPSTVPAAVRLKLWLKIGLRAFRLKCEAVEELTAPAPPANPQGAPPAPEAPCTKTTCRAPPSKPSAGS
jgi:hypothetical protein